MIKMIFLFLAIAPFAPIAPIALAGIEYPVAKGSKWTVYDTKAGEVVKRGVRWPRADGGEIKGLQDGLVFLRHVRTNKPVLTETQVAIESWVVDVPNNELRQAWTVRSMTADEILRKEARVARELEATVTSDDVAYLKAFLGAAGIKPGQVDTPAELAAQLRKRDRILKLLIRQALNVTEAE
jgi:hypothetical protein